MHPFVRNCIDRWEGQEGIDYAIFGHHTDRGVGSIAIAKEVSRRQAREELIKSRKRNLRQQGGCQCFRFSMVEDMVSDFL